MRIRSTTVLAVRREGEVAVAADGQVTLDKTIVKEGALKVRRLAGGSVLAGFAGGAADAFSLFSRFEAKLEEHGRRLERATVEMVRPTTACSRSAAGARWPLPLRARSCATASSEPRTSRGKRWASPPRSTSTPAGASSARRSARRSEPMVIQLPGPGGSSPLTPGGSGGHDDGLTPARVVEELDRFIVGQGAAKRGRQDRDRATPRPVDREPLPQDRGDQVHRGRLRGARL